MPFLPALDAVLPCDRLPPSHVASARRSGKIFSPCATNVTEAQRAPGYLLIDRRRLPPILRRLRLRSPGNPLPGLSFRFDPLRDHRLTAQARRAAPSAERPIIDDGARYLRDMIIRGGTKTLITDGAEPPIVDRRAGCLIAAGYPPWSYPGGRMDLSLSAASAAFRRPSHRYP